VRAPAAQDIGGRTLKCVIIPPESILTTGGFVTLPAPRAAEPAPDDEATYRKVTRHLLPFLMVCYVSAYLDRVNIGFARLQMLADLQFGETVYGIGAGMFFIGYFFFEVPSNLMLHRIGARVWIGRIMITWGIVSATFMFVRTPAMFYMLRFLLGVAEAGFYPGIILYLTRWYPSERRARMITIFMTAIPLSGIFGGPLSGWIMQSLAGRRGLAGWQWLFLIEALPALVLGLVVLWRLEDGIASARWLDDAEKRLLHRNMERDGAGIAVHPSLRAVFADRRIWRLCVTYFACSMGQYGLTFWMPTLIETAGVRGLLQIGFLTAVPYSGAVVAMLLLGRSADARRERRWHTAGPLFVGAVGLAASAAVGTHTAAALILLTVAAAGVISAAPLFWGLPTAFLRGVAAAAGIAAINSVANLAGFISPYVVSWLKDRTHSTEAGMYAVASVCVVGALAVFTVPAKLVNR
jgi:MFS family permease